MTALQTLSPKQIDLGGGFVVRRLLPSVQRQAVGPFLFFDHFGPVTAQPGDNHDVRPHPHIGLATVTYLLEGAMVHRDSTGAVQRIEPGAVNWMRAGRGIVHSERTPDDLRASPRRTHGLQLWVALPAEHEEVAPGFFHYPAADIPVHERAGIQVRVLVGAAYGLVSPVQTLSPTIYLDIEMAPGTELEVPALARELAVYGVDGEWAVDGAVAPAHHMVLLPPGETVRLQARTACRIMMIGGEPLGHRHIIWNFVSSRRERLVQAQADWRDQRFEPVPGETEFIPLPGATPPAN